MKRCIAYSSVAAAVLAAGAFVACADPGGLVVGPESYLSSIDGRPLDADKMKRLRADQGCGLWMNDGAGGIKTLAVRREQLGFKLPKAQRRADGSGGDGRALRTSFKPADVSDTIHVECWVPESMTLSDLVSVFGEQGDWKAMHKKLLARKPQAAAALQAAPSREAQQIRLEFIDPRIPELKIARAPAPGGANKDIVGTCSGQEAASKKGSVGRASFTVSVVCECYWLGPAYGNPPVRDWQCDYRFYQADGSTTGSMYLTFTADAFATWWIDENGRVGNGSGETQTAGQPASIVMTHSDLNVESTAAVTFDAVTNRSVARWIWTPAGKTPGTPSEVCGNQTTCTVGSVRGTGGTMRVFTPFDSASDALTVNILYPCFTSDAVATSYEPSAPIQMSIGSFDPVAFANALRLNKQPTPTGACAQYVRKALCAAGLRPACDGNDSQAWWPLRAKDYGDFLTKLGFRIVAVSQMPDVVCHDASDPTRLATCPPPTYSPAYTPQVGDIALFVYPPSGHIGGYAGGGAWISDFLQMSVYPNNTHQRPHVIYRR